MKNRYALTTGMLCIAAMAMIVVAGMPSNIAATDDIIPVTIPVTIELKSGSGDNKINLKSKGTISVTILAADDFDPAIVKPGSIDFAGAIPTKWSGVTGNSKKVKDLRLTFNVEQLHIDPDNPVLVLTGDTTTGTTVKGSITVKIVKS